VGFVSKFTPSPNLGASPFLLSLEWSKETPKMQTTKHSLVMQCKGRAQHPPFIVKIIHWPRSKDGSIPEMEKGSQRKAEPVTLGNIHPPPLQGRGPTQTPNLVEPIPYKTVRYHFLRYLMLMVPFLRTPARFMWCFFIINKNLCPRPLF
jgi:hypothetical protein